MNYSDNFKKSLALNDISKNDDILFMSNEIKSLESKVKNTSISIPSLDNVKSNNKLAQLAKDTVEKIKRNPFWDEYSIESKQKMVGKYFDSRIKRDKNCTKKYSLSEKIAFIDGVLKSVV